MLSKMRFNAATRRKFLISKPSKVLARDTCRELKALTIQPRKCRSDAIIARILAEKPKSSFAPSQFILKVPPLFTEPGWNLHTSEEIGVDDFQANRAPDKRYRTTPLKGLWTHTKRGFYHDGRFATIENVVRHYDNFFGLGLSDQQVQDLEEYLKSL